ncbi:MAG: branched-chain amino acid ABC transporter permease [Acidobacteria bacterium]|nr:branched-chain amino acid ABC transporter permease [Acidobacteriota bacterium]
MPGVFGAIDWLFIFEQTLNEAVDLNAIVFALAAIGLNVHFGYAGLLNFGQVGFVAAGAYGMGLAVTLWGLNPFLAVVVGMIFATIFALFLGIPTLRLRADYLAIVTIASAEILRLVARSTAMRNITRGPEGLNEFVGPFRELSPFNPSVSYGFGPFTWRGNQFFTVVVGWTLIFFFVFLVWQLMRSPWGRVVKAIREDEDAARALGKSAYWYKLQALILGGIIGGFGGMMLALGNATVQPDFFVAPLTFFFWLVLILGGAGRVWAPVLGSVIFWGLITFIQNLGRQLVDAGLIPTSIMDTSQVDQIRFWIVGAALALLMIFRPQGILGSKEEMALDAH